MSENHHDKSNFDRIGDLGGVLAGIQLGAQVVGYFGLGAFASVIVDVWIPFTRNLWARFFEWLSWPQISNLEKDALTALLFFAPVAIAALSRIITKGRTYSVDKSARFTGVIFGVLFIFIILRDLVAQIGTLISDGGFFDTIGWLQNYMKFFSFVVNSEFFMILVMTSSVIPLVYRFALEKRLKRYKREALRVGNLERIDEEKYFYAMGRGKIAKFLRLQRNVIVPVSTGYILLGLLLGGRAAYEVAGPLTLFLVFLSVLFMSIAAIFDPRRLHVTFGALLVIVVVSYFWNIVEWGGGIITCIANNTC